VKESIVCSYVELIARMIFHYNQKQVIQNLQQYQNKMEFYALLAHPNLKLKV
jgi:hypothetical protein